MTPLNSRSKTAKRLILSSEKLLRAQDFGASSLAEIARGAALTTGAVYSTVGSKAGLLQALEGVAAGAVEAEALEAIEGAPKDLEAFLDAVLRRVIAVYTRHRGVLRALAVASRDDGALAGRLAAVNRRILRGFGDAIISRHLKRPATGMRERAEIAFLVITSALRDRLIFDVPWPLSTPLTPDRLREDLKSMALAYLARPAGQ
jgi:AcrR family transcriptional regulator